MNSLEIQPINTPTVSNEDILNLPNLPSNPQPSSQGTYDQINELFSNQDEQEKTIREAREILGDSVKDLADSQVYDLVTEVQFLVDSWLEDFERDVFDGKTLDEIIGG
jgi:hypothetical protein